MIGVRRPDDGGGHWEAYPGFDMDTQGDRNQRVAVNRFNPEFVVIGWRLSGPLMSFDSEE